MQRKKSFVNMMILDVKSKCFVYEPEVMEFS